MSIDNKNIAPEDVFQTEHMRAPISIKEHATQILRNATRVVEAIIEADAKLKAAGDFRPLHVIFEEYHDEVSGRLVQLAVMDALEAGGKVNIVCQMEEPSNSLSMAFFDRAYAAQPLWPQIYEFDQAHQGLLSYEAFATYANPQQTAYSRFLAQNYCADNWIRTSLIDAARYFQDGKHYIETADEITQAAIKTVTGKEADPAQKMATPDLQTFNIRNHAMFMNGNDNAPFISNITKWAQEDVRLIVLKTIGAAHGWQHFLFPELKAEDTVPALHRAAEENVLCVATSHIEKFTPPVPQYLEPEQFIALEMATLTAKYDPFPVKRLRPVGGTNGSAPKNVSDIQSLADEYRYVSAIFNHPDYRELHDFITEQTPEEISDIKSARCLVMDDMIRGENTPEETIRLINNI